MVTIFLATIALVAMVILDVKITTLERNHTLTPDQHVQAEDKYFAFQGWVESVAFGVMILLLIVAWITLMVQLNAAFGNAMK